MIRSGNPDVTANHFRSVAKWMSAERRRSLDALEYGNPENPHWHADHVEFLEHAAATIGIRLDADNEVWIEERRTELQAEFDASLQAKIAAYSEPYKEQREQSEAFLRAFLPGAAEVLDQE